MFESKRSKPYRWSKPERRSKIEAAETVACYQSRRNNHACTPFNENTDISTLIVGLVVRVYCVLHYIMGDSQSRYCDNKGELARARLRPDEKLIAWAGLVSHARSSSHILYGAEGARSTRMVHAGKYVG